MDPFSIMLRKFSRAMSVNEIGELFDIQKTIACAKIVKFSLLFYELGVNKF
jgi:hypothetical protein